MYQCDATSVLGIPTELNRVLNPKSSIGWGTEERRHKLGSEKLRRYWKLLSIGRIRRFLWKVSEALNFSLVLKLSKVPGVPEVQLYCNYCSLKQRIEMQKYSMAFNSRNFEQT